MVDRRAALHSLWVGRCDIIVRQAVTDSVTKITHFEDVTVTQNEPCRLSFDKVVATGDTSTVAGISQGVRLFLAPDVEVRAGAKIVVTQNGQTTEYERSGVPAFYVHHQEIKLELFGGWA